MTKRSAERRVILAAMRWQSRVSKKPLGSAPWRLFPYELALLRACAALVAAKRRKK